MRASKMHGALDMLYRAFLYSARCLENIALSNYTIIEPANSRSTAASKPGRLLALDLGQKRVGVAVTDELRISIRPLPALRRTSWKQLVHAVAALVRDFDAQSLVIGLPLSLDGTENLAAQEVKRQAHNLELSLRLPVLLQDERLTSVEAESELRQLGYTQAEVLERIDSHAATLILRDYLWRE
jgi:putative Holliday junction resolvase